MTERAAGDAFLYSRLKGSSSLVALLPNGIHADAAPDGTNAENGAYLVFTFATSNRITANDRILCAAECTYAVRAVFFGNVSAADDADALIDSLLSNATGGELKVEQNGFAIDCMRVRDRSELNQPMARTYRQVGGWYRVTLRRIT